MGKFILENINFQEERDFEQKNQIFVNKLILNNKDKLFKTIDNKGIGIISMISQKEYADGMKFLMKTIPYSLYFKNTKGELNQISRYFAKTIYNDRENVKDDNDKKQALLQTRTFFQDVADKLDNVTTENGIDIVFETIISGKYTDKELFGWDEFVETIKQENDIMENNIVFNNVEEYIKDGNPKYMHTIKTPRKDSNGNVLGVFGLSIEMTEQKKNEKELEEQKQALEMKNSELTSAEEELRQNLEELETTQEELKQKIDALQLAEENLKRKNLELIHMGELDTIFMNNSSDNVFMKQIVCVHGSDHCIDILKTKTEEDINLLTKDELKILAQKIHFPFEKVSLSQARLLTNKRAHCSKTLTEEITKEIYGKNDFDFFDDEHALEAFRDEIKIFITGIGINDREEEVVDKEGKRKRVSVSKYPVKDKEGKVVKIIGIARDITERKKLEREMQYKSDTLDELFANTKDTIYIKDENSRFIRVSQSWLIMMKNQIGDEGILTTPENIIGKTDEGFFKKPTHHIDTFSKEQVMMDKAKLFFEIYKNLNSFPKSDYIQEIEEHFNKDGDKIRIEAIKRPIILDNKVCLMGISRDITESELQKEVLIQAKNKAEESDRLKSSFLANMSHEIRTPMNAVMGFSQLLEQEYLTPQEKSMYINLIHQGGRRLLSLIDDILDFSKIESNTLKISKNNVSINKKSIEDVRNAVLMASKQKSFSKNKNINFINNLNGHNINVLGDINRINQILINIFSNAIKFVPEDFGEIEIDVISQYNELKFSIKNNGPKIPDNMIKKIFDSFVKEESTLHEGVGLGLSISRSLVELMGGNIWVENDDNSENGVTFNFTLPLSKLPD